MSIARISNEKANPKGILGLNALGGMELDPIVMASLVISIGFSVDIPAHVSYHFKMAGILYYFKKIKFPCVKEYIRCASGRASRC